MRIGLDLLIRLMSFCSPIADDAYSRIYWSGDTRMGGALLYSYAGAVNAVTGGGTEYPNKLLQVGNSCAKQKPTTILPLLHQRMM